MKHVNAQCIAEALGISRQAVVKRATREGWKTTMITVRGGREKRYLVKYLPVQIRMELAKHLAGNRLSATSPAELAGAAAGQSRLQAECKREERERITAEARLAAFAEISQEKQAMAYARKDVLAARDNYLQASAAATIKDGTRQFCELYNSGEIRIADHIKKHVKKISWSTINRWQRTLTAEGLAGLAPGYHNPKKGSTQLTPEQVDFILGMLNKHPHCKFSTLQMGLEARFEQLPSMSCIRRFVNTWKEKNAGLFLFISNPDKWRNERQFAVGDASEQVVRLNQVWEFDSTPADVMLADGRHCLIGVTDVYCRRLKLQVSKTSKSTAVAALTRRALLDWGVPETAKTDNGADYISRHMVQVFESLGIEQQLCPPFTPEAKPHIERAFKTFAHSFQELMPGYIGHSVADRKDIEARRSFASRIMDKDGAVEISMTAEELQHYCDRWCEAIYHQNKHRSLNDRSPAEVARAWREAVRAVSNERALDILLAEAPSGGVRTVTKNGVSVDNITYISDALPEVGTRVRVKIDTTDLGTIYLFDESGTFLCVAQDPLRTGIDRAETAVKLRNRQKQLVQEGRTALRKNAKEQALDEIHEEILSSREAKIDNLVSLPPRRQGYSTPELEEAAKAADAFQELSQDSASPKDINIDIEPEKPAPKQEKIHMIRSDADQYEMIWMQLKQQKRRLTRNEYDWLTKFYETAGGRSYKALQGDLREKIGLAENQAEG